MSSELDQLVASARRHAARPSALQKQSVKQAVLTAAPAASALALGKVLLGGLTVVGMVAVLIVLPRIFAKNEPVVIATPVEREVTVQVVAPPMPATEPAVLPAPSRPARANKPIVQTKPAPIEAAPQPATLGEELELLRAATAAVETEQFIAAGATLDRYDARIGHPRFATEAGLLRALTLCGLHHEAHALAIARELVQRDGANPLIQRLRGTCADSALDP